VTIKSHQPSALLQDAALQDATAQYRKQADDFLRQMQQIKRDSEEKQHSLRSEKEQHLDTIQQLQQQVQSLQTELDLSNQQHTVRTERLEQELSAKNKSHVYNLRNMLKEHTPRWLKQLSQLSRGNQTSRARLVTVICPKAWAGLASVMARMLRELLQISRT